MALSAKQKEILAYLADFQARRGFSPSVREIGEAVSLRSTSSVHNHLATLEERGYIRRDPSKSRSIEILRSGDDDGSSKEKMFDSTSLFLSGKDPNSSEPVMVPMIRKIQIGKPLMSPENIERYYPLPEEACGIGECFLIRFQGESMINAGILDGDVMLVHVQRQAQDKDIVVAVLGDSVTIKTFYHEKNYIRLQPENSLMSPILIKECPILGKVIGLYRQFGK